MFRRSITDAIRAFVFLAACLTGANQTTQAQTSGISGSVSDTSGGAVSGAKITAVNQTTNTETTVLADAAGQFTLDKLPAGTYTVKAEFPGFTPYEKKGVTSPSTLQISISP